MILYYAILILYYYYSTNIQEQIIPQKLFFTYSRSGQFFIWQLHSGLCSVDVCIRNNWICNNFCELFGCCNASNHLFITFGRCDC